MNNPIRRAARFISGRIYRYPVIHAALKTCFLTLPPWIRGRQMLWDSLVELGRRPGKVVVLQIGANDGEQSDPVAHFIRRHRWEAMLVEPVPSIFAQLQRNYADCDGLTFVNAAVSEHDEVRSFYFLDDPKNELPPWARGLGSFQEKHVTDHAIPGRDIRTCLRKIDVPCLSLASPLEKYGVRRVDVLVIDAQGFDYHIVKQILFDHIRPHLVIYEHILLSPEDRRVCDERLRSRGYTVESDRWDVLATLNG